MGRTGAHQGVDIDGLQACRMPRESFIKLSSSSSYHLQTFDCVNSEPQGRCKSSSSELFATVHFIRLRPLFDHVWSTTDCDRPHAVQMEFNNIQLDTDRHATHYKPVTSAVQQMTAFKGVKIPVLQVAVRL